MVTLLLATTLMAAAADPPGRGVSEALAAERAATVQDLRYEVQFVVPPDRREPISGHVVVHLSLKAPHRLVFDFAQPADRVRRMSINGQEVQPQLVAGHLVIPAEATRAGANEVNIEFIAGDESLNRNDD